MKKRILHAYTGHCVLTINHILCIMVRYTYPDTTSVIVCIDNTRTNLYTILYLAVRYCRV